MRHIPIAVPGQFPAGLNPRLASLCACSSEHVDFAYFSQRPELQRALSCIREFMIANRLAARFQPVDKSTKP
jgi:hypothetical protein